MSNEFNDAQIESFVAAALRLYGSEEKFDLCLETNAEAERVQQAFERRGCVVVRSRRPARITVAPPAGPLHPIKESTSESIPTPA